MKQGALARTAIRLSTLGISGALCFVPLALLAGSEARGEAAGPPDLRVTFNDGSDGVRGAQAAFYIKASPDVVWDVVTSSRKSAQLFKAMKAIKSSSRGSNFREYHISSIIGDKLIICKITRNASKRFLAWKRVSGHLVEMRGLYEITEDAHYPGYSRIRYESYIDPGAIGRLLMTNKGRQRDIVYMVAKMRSLVGST